MTNINQKPNYQIFIKVKKLVQIFKEINPIKLVIYYYQHFRCSYVLQSLCHLSADLSSIISRTYSEPEWVTCPQQYPKISIYNRADFIFIACIHALLCHQRKHGNIPLFTHIHPFTCLVKNCQQNCIRLSIVRRRKDASGLQKMRIYKVMEKG